MKSEIQLFAVVGAFFCLRPLEPVSTFDARIWEPHGTPSRVECGKEPNLVFTTLPSA